MAHWLSGINTVDFLGCVIGKLGQRSLHDTPESMIDDDSERGGE